MSQITTHILDTSIGKPAAYVDVWLEKEDEEGELTLLGAGQTNEDGRFAGLLEKDVILEPGIYRISFDTRGYYRERGIESFYPIVTISFETKDSSHYHVPLLLNPFGFSTYRGS